VVNAQAILLENIMPNQKRFPEKQELKAGSIACGRGKFLIIESLDILPNVNWKGIRAAENHSCIPLGNIYNFL